jgi:RNA ligase (TIGR02306 family)
MEESILPEERVRKLASVQLVTALRPHPDPEVERLELATVQGWQLVVAKGEVEVGQVIIYCEIDSRLPANAVWLPPAVRKRVETQPEHKRDWFRVKSIRLRGQLSQGLIVPSIPVGVGDVSVGDDVTEALGIKKYEPVSFSGKFAMCQTNSGIPFPTHLVSKTDEPRVQSNPELFAAIKDQSFYAAVKLDGTSATYVIDPKTDEFCVCSRNYIRQRPENLDVCPYWRAAVNENIEEKLRRNPHLAVQGEICGPGIQKNPLKLKDIRFFVFNVIDIRNGRHALPFDAFEASCKTLNLESVPIEEVADRFEYETIDDVLERAKGSYASGRKREGLVFRSWNQAISFKAINNDYLF